MPAKDATEPRPEGWEKLSREGSPTGATTGYCPVRKQFYHVSSGGEIAWHTMPDGWKYDPEKDELAPIQSAKAEAAREAAINPPAPVTATEGPE